MRAFLNGRIDLTQAEAVRDLIDSQTLYQARVAAQQLDGSVSRRLQPIKQQLVELIALLGGRHRLRRRRCRGDARRADHRPHRGDPRAAEQRLEEGFQFGKVVHEGLTLAIVGRPNVGKSSLFNRLVERERAIVTATPGTTRDLVTETVALGGIPVHLVDTAGIRHALDEAESIGIRKSMEALADADLVLVVLDASQQPSTKSTARTAGRRERAPGHRRAENKSDLRIAAGSANRRQRAAHAHGAVPVVRTSALTGEGIERLRERFWRCVRGQTPRQRETGMLTNLRQQDCVPTYAGIALDAAEAVGRRHNTPHEMILLDLYNALRALDEAHRSHHRRRHPQS
jgi:tRNA modification GTPase